MSESDPNFRIDGYKFLPKSMIPEFKDLAYQADEVVKAVPTVALTDARVALLTSGGLYLKDRQPSFDLERERHDPYWGDPTYRIIPRELRKSEVAVAHLHLNPDDLAEDYNIALPLEAFAELENEGVIGALAENNYSFMGYQGRSTDAWRDIYGPELARRLMEERVNLLILAPT